MYNRATDFPKREQENIFFSNLSDISRGDCSILQKKNSLCRQLYFNPLFRKFPVVNFVTSGGRGAAREPELVDKFIHRKNQSIHPTGEDAKDHAGMVPWLPAF